jgi:hypothetical protein
VTPRPRRSSGGASSDSPTQTQHCWICRRRCESDKWYTVPAGAERRREWEAVMGVPLKKDKRLCSAHFDIRDTGFVPRSEQGQLPHQSTPVKTPASTHAQAREAIFKAHPDLVERRLEEMWGVIQQNQKELAEYRRREAAGEVQRAELIARHAQEVAEFDELLGVSDPERAFDVTVLQGEGTDAAKEQRLQRWIGLPTVALFEQLEEGVGAALDDVPSRPGRKALPSRRTYSNRCLITITLIYLNTTLSYEKLSRFLRVSEGSLKRWIPLCRAALAEYFAGRVCLDAEQWREQCPPEVIKACSKHLKSRDVDCERDKILVVLADGTYLYTPDYTDFDLHHMVYSDQKKKCLVKSHEYMCGNGTLACFTLAGGDVDDEALLKADLENENSTIRRLIDDAKEKELLVVLLLDGGYDSEKTRQVIKAAGIEHWIKKNKPRGEKEGTRQAQAESVDADNQMIARATIERGQINVAKSLARLRQSNLSFYETLYLPDMLEISHGLAQMRAVPLYSGGAMTKNQFGLIGDEILEILSQAEEGTLPSDWIDEAGDGDDGDQLVFRGLEEIPPEIDFGDLFSVPSLRGFFSHGRVMRGSRFVDLNWVFDTVFFTIRGDNYLYVNGKVHHSREQGSALHVTLAIPVGDLLADASLSDAAMSQVVALANICSRCDCYKGTSGQCGHVLALCLALLKAKDEEAYQQKFQKNRDGKNRPTRETLRKILTRRGTKQGKAKTKRNNIVRQAPPTDGRIGKASASQIEPVAPKRKKVYVNPKKAAPKAADRKRKKTEKKSKKKKKKDKKKHKKD